MAYANGRVVMGMPGCRDTDPELNCEVFTPGEPGTGECYTDGHYMCRECSHMSLRALRRRDEQCEDCGTPLERYGCPKCEPEWCPMRDGGAG